MAEAGEGVAAGPTTGDRVSLGYRRNGDQDFADRGIQPGLKAQRLDQLILRNNALVYQNPAQWLPQPVFRRRQFRFR